MYHLSPLLLSYTRWFCGRIKRIDAEEQLMSSINNYGSYLIRESESTVGRYSLSVRDKDQVRHYKILQSDNQEFYINAHSMFKTLQDLVIHHQQDADGLCVNLKNPCVLSLIDVARQVVDEWQTDRSDVRLVGKLLISGEFTAVWEGRWNNTTPVAVKTLKQNQIITVNDFLQSANLMKKLQHSNLVQLYALCSMEEPVLIITELMKNGSLLEYLHGEGTSLLRPQLISMTVQVAAGMAYLEGKKVIHRDLAARNIQVGEGIVCKVANFELARVMDKAIYEGQKGEIMAAKWAAPEAVLHNIFNIRSDVWSFGIVLYEIITHGSTPYPDMTNAEVIAKIEQGYRMPKPLLYHGHRCPLKLYDMMLNCWQKYPNDRPTFAILQRELDCFYSGYDKVKLNAK